MRETETFEYIRRKYPDKEETWRKVTRLVKFDENLEVKSVHDFNMECYISSLADSYGMGFCAIWHTEINTIFPVCSQIRTETKYGLRDTRLLCRLSSWETDGGMTP